EATADARAEFLEPSQGVWPVHPLHQYVEQDHRNLFPMPPVRFDGLMAVTGQPDLESFEAKSCCQDAQHRRLVIHDKYAGRRIAPTILGRSLDLLPCQSQVEELVQPRDRKDLMDPRTQVANGQVPPPGEQLLVQAEQCAERRAGAVFDVAEVEEQ